MYTIEIRVDIDCRYGGLFLWLIHMLELYSNIKILTIRILNIKGEIKMKKLTDVISLKQAENPQMQYHIYISTKRDIELEDRIDLAEKDKEEQIQTELIEFLENQDNENEFILVGNQAVKVNEIIYVKVESLRYFGF